VVGKEAASALLEYYHRPGSVDPHLADQIVLYFALAKDTSSFTTTDITAHLLTNIAVIERFTHGKSLVEGNIGSSGRVTIEGVGFLKE
jgi:RNA 3'-terminal phosphate cyclase (ATP)